MSIPARIYTVLTEGDLVTIPFSVVNTSNVNVTGATVVFDAFPAGVTFVAATKDVGTYTTLTRTWALPTIKPEQVETIYLTFETVDLTSEVLINGVSTGVDNASSPGEHDTNNKAVIRLAAASIPGLSFSGWEVLKNVAAYTNSGTQTLAAEDSGNLYVLSPSGNIEFELPSIGGNDSGMIFTFKVINANSHTITLTPANTETIDGSSDLTLSTTESVTIVSCKSCAGGGNRWIITSLYVD